MTRRGHGLSCLKIWHRLSRIQRRVLLAILIVVIAIGIEEISRRLLLAHSLYSLNLHTNITPAIMPAPTRGEKILIFAPHEDDETLGCAGYIQQAVAAGANVHLVLMTNGEFPEIDVVLFGETLLPKPQAYIRLGYRRQSETLKAMKYLGLSQGAVTFLGYPNQYLNLMWLPGHWMPNHPVRSIRTRASSSPYRNSFTKHAVYCGQSVLSDIEKILLIEQPDTVITLHPNDVHVDHWPTYTFVQFALNELALQGYPFAERCKVYTYLIHRDYWPVPRGYFPALSLEPPAKLADIGNTEWLALPLTFAQTIDKHKATAMYRTQGGSFDPLLLSFARSNELYGVISIYTWPSQQEVPHVAVINDAAGDLASSGLNPNGDILEVRLTRHQKKMLLAIETRGVVSKKITYHVSMHAGGRSPADRLFLQYDWQGNNISGIAYINGQLRPAPHGIVIIHPNGHLITLFIPWPFDANQRFFMIRAWTTSGRRIVDQTLTNTFRIDGTATGGVTFTPALKPSTLPWLMPKKSLNFHKE